MEDYKKLVDNLRSEPCDRFQAALSIYDLCIDAADKIENLMTENAALRQQESKVTVTLPIGDMNLRSIVLKKLRGVEYQYTQMHSLMTENIADTICQGIEECLVQKERNDPLTPDELRDIPCDHPVYIVAGCVSWWDIVDFGGLNSLYLKVEGSLPFKDYGKNWLAYRHKPEELA